MLMKSYLTTGAILLWLASSLLASSHFVASEDFDDGNNNLGTIPELTLDWDLNTPGIQGPAQSGSDYRQSEGLGVPPNDGNALFAGQLWVLSDRVRIFLDFPFDVTTVQLTGVSNAPNTQIVWIGVDVLGGVLMETHTFPEEPEPFTIENQLAFGAITAVDFSGLEAALTEMQFVPEPGTYSLLAGLLCTGFVLVVRRRRLGRR